MAGGGSDATYYYDDLGRVKKEVDGNGITKEYDYDANNNRTAFIVKQGGATLLNTTYVYDSMNRLWKVLENGQVVATYTYDINGNRDTLTYGNGVSTKYDYNSANKLKGLTNKNAAGSVLSKYDYTYYLDGNQASKADASQGTTNYKYDGLGRISTVEGANGLFKRYGYDDRNNRSDLTGTGEIFTYAEDMSFQYDGLNQLKSAVGHSASTYNYNGDGLRQTKTVDGITTTQVLDGGNVAVEIKGNEITKYVRGVNLITQEKNGQRYYYLYNGHGDVVQIVDNAGNVVNNYEYDEWGNITGQTEGIENPFKYAGEYFDKETGLYYLRTRYYDPTIGRFISEDSYPGKDNDPLSLNLYTYCHNNPVNLFDPSGHEAASPDGTSGKAGLSASAYWKLFYAEKDATLARIKQDVKDAYPGIGDDEAEIAARGIYFDALNEIAAYGQPASPEDIYAAMAMGKLLTGRDLYGRTAPEIDTNKISSWTGNSVPKNRTELNRQLTDRGFNCKGTTEGGYVEYKHSDGTTVWVRPDGEIITVKKEWLPDGSKKVPVRYNWDGTPVKDGGHNTGEFVEPIEGATFLPPRK